jgi:hypothetical protein
VWNSGFSLLLYDSVDFFALFPASQIINRVSQEEGSIFWEVTVSVILSKKKKVYMYTCSMPNGFQGRAISLYSSKIVDKKEILHTDSNFFSIPVTGLESP